MRNTIFLVFLLVAIAVMAWALPGRCQYCAPYSCFDSSSCGSGCFCAHLNGNLQGTCMSVD